MLNLFRAFFYLIETDLYDAFLDLFSNLFSLVFFKIKVISLA